MPPDRWRRLEDLFHAALERPRAERDAFLASACDGDQELRKEVERLLHADEQASAFVDSAAAGVERIAVDVRRELPANRRFWEVLEYEVVPSRPGLADYLLTLERPVPRAIAVPDALAMRDVGAQLAPLLRPGDLVLLHGPLGAGKTTLTQGLAAALHVRGAVTSPTFVIARAHPGRLPLVHVDAYRVGSGLEVDDLDLDTSLEESVTVVEWGEGLVEDLAADRLEVRIERAEEADDERRVVVVEAFGPRWTGVALPGADTAG
jgi:tRNA threonylcarbamoyladenosine biosynthesis protein TsaE